jgi:hypothetical protein
MIQDVRFMRGPDCDSDHFIVEVMIKQKLICNKVQRMTEKREIWNDKAINDPEVLEKYRESTQNKFIYSFINNNETGE